MSAPSWDQLFVQASAQAGYVTTRQAKEAGYSDPLLYKYVKSGRLERARRGVYRIVHYPTSDEEQLVILWLWSERKGVFSHETALSRHGLSDLLPHRIEMTLPSSWKARRVKTPKGLEVFYSDIPKADRTWFGAVQITAPLRTVLDCRTLGVSPEFLQQAERQGIERGLFTQAELDAMKAEL